eukprot:TRINITY_DN8766_c0_g1_i16.p1 TRINITY_DN8766_c0_g1~~TRINITY_DN8766_c0_g1_i16.p1  ORF type:complete len:497 (-),score=156.15 TRINITY_DN8766_c0_g1_i16:1287-2777(-)
METQDKENLLHTMGETGLLDKMKSEMRGKLIERLKMIDPSKKRPAGRKGEEFIELLVSSFIIEYLASRDLAYSVSVFVPESGYSDKLLTKEEALKVILRHNKTLKFPTEQEEAVLYLMVKQMLTPPSNEGKTNRHAQTEKEDMDVSSKMKKIEEKYLEGLTAVATGRAKESEAVFNKVKSDVEARLRYEFEAELRRIREVEMAGVRIEEAQRARDRMEAYKREIDNMYIEKLDALKKRETETIELFNRKLQELDKKAYEQRQDAMTAMDRAKDRENDRKNLRKEEGDIIMKEREKIAEAWKEIRREQERVDDLRHQLHIKNKEEFEKMRARAMPDLVEMERVVEGLRVELRLLTEEKKMWEMDMKKVELLHEQLHRTQRELDERSEFIRERLSNEASIHVANKELTKRVDGLIKERAAALEQVDAQQRLIEILQKKLNELKEDRQLREKELTARERGYQRAIADLQGRVEFYEGEVNRMLQGLGLKRENEINEKSE